MVGTISFTSSEHLLQILMQVSKQRKETKLTENAVIWNIRVDYFETCKQQNESVSAAKEAPCNF